MLREALCCFLILMLVGLGRPVLAAEQTVQEVKDKVRQMEDKRLTCKVKMKDGTLLVGKISQSSSESFTLGSEDGPRTVASYADVAEVQRKGLHPAAKAAIWIGAVFGALLAASVIYCDKGGCS